MADDQREAVLYTLARYFHLLDQGDFASLYLEVMDRRTRDRMGLEEFVQALQEMEIRGRAQLQAVEDVRVEGGRAHVKVAAALAGYAGDLDFELAREDGGWRVVRFNPLDLQA